MKTVTLHHLADPKPTAIIVELDPAGESCPQCGASLEVGTSACAYCRTPVAEMVTTT